MSGVNVLGVYNTRTGQGFNTIQAAVDSENTLNGDTITIADGTYTENVVISKSITIKPVSGANVTVKPVDSSSPVFTIICYGSLQGLNINSGACGIY